MGRGRPSKQKDAREWLEKYVQRSPNGMRFAKDIIARGSLEGYGFITLQRAKKELGYRSIRREDKWFWFNPLFLSAGQSPVEEATRKLEQVSVDVMALAQTRAAQTQERARKRKNAKCANKNILAQAAGIQRSYNKTFDQTVSLIQGMARSKPCDPPLTDEELINIVREEYGIPKPADIRF